jgi:hypothetical protein
MALVLFVLILLSSLNKTTPVLQAETLSDWVRVSLLRLPLSLQMNWRGSQYPKFYIISGLMSRLMAKKWQKNSKFREKVLAIYGAGGV